MANPKVQLVGIDGEPVGVLDGSLAIGPPKYNTATFNNMDAINTAYIFAAPMPGEKFIIDGVVMSANRNVGADGTTVEFYEGATAITTTASKDLLQFDLAKNTSIAFVQLKMEVTEGVWLLGKNDDDDVLATILGYYVRA